MMVKDITRFKNRDPKRSVLMDSQHLNFLFSPENGLPIIEYRAEMDSPPGETDPYLLSIIEELKEIMTLDDVRPYIEETYKIRSLLKNSKLI
jgi:hypothetical protein